MLVETNVSYAEKCFVHAVLPQSRSQSPCYPCPVFHVPREKDNLGSGNGIGITRELISRQITRKEELISPLIWQMVLIFVNILKEISCQDEKIGNKSSVYFPITSTVYNALINDTRE